MSEMKAYQIKDPRTVPHEKLAQMLDQLQDFLYWEEDSGQMILNPDKSVSGADLGQFIDEWMQEHGLYPTEFGPKDWSPKRKR